jgi:hypothetical protein
MSAQTPISPQEEALLKAVRSLDYGSVEVIIHEKRIVEVQQKRKVRFPQTASPAPRTSQP